MIKANAKAISVVLRKQRLKIVAAQNVLAAWLEGNEKLLEQLTIPIMSWESTWQGRTL